MWTSILSEKGTHLLKRRVFLLQVLKANELLSDNREGNAAQNASRTAVGNDLHRSELQSTRHASMVQPYM
jgi:hypothetical protein